MGIPVEFDSQGCTLQGRFYCALGEPPFPTILLLSGFPGNETDVLQLGQGLAQHGVNTLTFNYCGTHHSEGTFSMRQTLEDVQAAWSYLHQEGIVRRFQIDTTRVVLGGYSYGGGMALVYAAGHPEIPRVLSIAGTDHGELARAYQGSPALAATIDAMFEELKAPSGPVQFEGKEAMKELTQNPAPYDLRLRAEVLADRDILLIGGWDDLNVTIEDHLLPFYRALVASHAPRVHIVALQDDHAFEKSREELEQIVADWILAA
jgi:pimeloyl-ACP methyl ester carboxylesterase